MAALLAQLHPEPWRVTLTTRFTDRPNGIDELFDMLSTQEAAWKGYMGHVDDHTSRNSTPGQS